MTDDLQAWQRIVSDAYEERKARIAGTLSIVAIAMLIVAQAAMTYANRSAHAQLDAATEQAAGATDTAERALALADKFAGIVAHCANEGAFVIDDLLIFCDRQRVRVAGQ